jgi:hypothetical protein
MQSEKVPVISLRLVNIWLKLISGKVKHLHHRNLFKVSLRPLHVVSLHPVQLIFLGLKVILFKPSCHVHFSAPAFSQIAAVLNQQDPPVNLTQTRVHIDVRLLLKVSED